MNGRQFNLLKFRTMVAGADRLKTSIHPLLPVTDNWSLSQDFKIIIKIIPTALRGTGIDIRSLFSASFRTERVPGR